MSRPRDLALTAAGLLPVALVPAAASADSEVRWLHAVPGAGQGEVDAGHQALARATFGKLTPYVHVPPGRTRLKLDVGGKTVAMRSMLLADHARYTIVALAPSSGVRLAVLHDGAARSGVARLRVFHAAPELGAPDVRLDGRTVMHHFAFGTASPYLSLEPGTHSASAVRPGTSSAVVKTGAVKLAGGTASTAYVLGTRGQAVRVVLARDARVVGVARKRAAPTRGVHVVRPGECLWTIAARHLGGHANDRQILREVLRLWALNKADVPSGDPDVIVPGQRLRFA